MTAELKRVSRDPGLHESTLQSVAAAQIHRPWRTKGEWQGARRGTDDAPGPQLFSPRSRRLETTR